MRAAADRRAGQFRLGRRRSAGGACATPRRGSRRSRIAPARRSREGHRRLPGRITTTTSTSRSVLPARFPNLLVNGAGGIAVGMATNIPPHNLGEVDRRLLSPIIDKPDITIDELMELVPGPDFPTGGSILGRARHPRRLHDRPRLDHHARQDRGRRDAQGPRGDHRHRDPLSGQQGDADRAHRRARAREARRGHLRPARRVRSRRHAHRHRDQARRGRRRRAQPALALHRAAVELRRQHARAERRPAGAADADRHAARLRRFPRGSRHPAHQISCSPRRATTRTCRSASPSRSPISTR